jgi:G3E family GTPase
MSNSLSVTVFTASPGTDGARVFDRVLGRPDGLRLTAIVPKRGQKRNRSSHGASVLPTTERLVQLGKGCSCCTVRGDLMSKIRRIAEEGLADHIVIQTGRGSDLTTLAKTFTVADGSGSVLSHVARFQNLVTVIDARSFSSTLQSSSARELIDRIELANVIVLEGTADLSSDEKERVRCAAEALNSDVEIAESDDEGFSLSSVQAKEPFDLNAGQRRSLRYARDSNVDPSSLVVRFDFQERRPFHPGRLHSFLAEDWPGLLRVKGSFWMASRPDQAGSIDVAGSSRITSFDGMWWSSVPAHRRPDSPEFRQYMKKIWHPEFGDRHHDLAIVGVGLDEEELRVRLDQCLLTDEELVEPSLWSTMPDPFPSSQVW